MSKRYYGLLIGVLLLAGVGIPAGFGFVQEKAVELGVNDLLESSTQFDNITNSTYFEVIETKWWDDETGNKYIATMVTDEEENMNLVMFERGEVYGTFDSGDEHGFAYVQLNKTALENVDKLVIYVVIKDPASLNISNAEYELLLSVDGTNIVQECKNVSLNITKFEITLDTLKRLKIESGSTVVLQPLRIIPKEGKSIELDNVIAGFRVELYDTKKVDSNLITNAMLAVGGFTMIIGAFAATPFWNPSKSGFRIGRRR